MWLPACINKVRLCECRYPMQIRRTPFIAAGILWIAPLASAQFYNEARDKKAQQAEAAAGQIANGALFEKIKGFACPKEAKLDALFIASKPVYVSS